MTPTTRRIEWAGPEGWTIFADEDGAHLRAHGGASLEMPDVECLFKIWDHARRAIEQGTVSAPKPPTREEIRAMSSDQAARYAAKRAHDAIEREFNPPDMPF